MRLDEVVLGAEVAEGHAVDVLDEHDGALGAARAAEVLRGVVGHRAAHHEVARAVRRRRAPRRGPRATARPARCPAGRDETKRRLLRLALEGEPKRHRVLPAHREHLRQLAAQEVLADAPVGRAPAVGVARVPAAQREGEARVEQHQHHAEQRQRDHELDQREAAPGARRLTCAAPGRGWRGRALRSRPSEPCQSTRTSTRYRAYRLLGAGCAGRRPASRSGVMRRGPAEAPVLGSRRGSRLPSSACSTPAASSCDCAIASARECSSRSPARASPAEKISNAGGEHEREQRRRRTTTSISVNPRWRPYVI